MKVQWVTNAGNLATRRRLLATEVRGNLRSAAKEYAEKMKAQAIILSSGTLSVADKKRLGFPYSTRLMPGAAGQPDFLINVVSGDFKNAFRTRVQETRRGWTITLTNTDKAAPYMMGTPKMRVRPIFLQVDLIMRGDLPGRVRKVTRRAVAESASAPSLLFGIAYAASAGITSFGSGIREGLSG